MAQRDRIQELPLPVGDDCSVVGASGADPTSALSIAIAIDAVAHDHR